MKKINALVLAGDNGDIAVWLKAFAGATIVESMEDANLVVFVGGSDVTPSIYGETNVASYCDWHRDVAEREIFDYCRAHGIAMFGICRGSQFLHTGMGGKMWQDVTGHANGQRHPILDHDTGAIIPSSCSTHHQMARMAWTNCLSAERNGFELFATPPEPLSQHYRCDTTQLYWSADGRLFGDRSVLSYDEAHDGIREVEGFRYPEAKIMAFQGHPEWGDIDYAAYAGRKLMAWFDGLEDAPARVLGGAIEDGSHLRGELMA